MNNYLPIINSFLRIIGLTILIVIPSFAIWYIWFGPGIEVEATFPSDSQGEFLQQPVVSNASGQILVDWVVPANCIINEIEFQPIGQAAQDSWMGGTADCVKENNSFACQVDLTNRELVVGVKYQLQTHNSQCTNGQSYVSEVTTFSI